MAPDPEDIDVVFYLDPTEVDELPKELQEKFSRLFLERKFMRNLYRVEVYYGIAGSEADYLQWKRTFETHYDNITPKGIFRIVYK